MSDVTAQQADNQTLPATPEPVAPQPITQETIDDLRAKGDREGIDKAIEQITSPPKPVGDVPQSPADQEILVNKDQQATDDGKKKVFRTTVRGQPVEYDGPDNYFGMENFGRMKKSYVHAKEEAVFQKTQTREARETATAALQEKARVEQQLNDTQSKMKELEDRIAAISAAPPQPAAADIPPQPSSPEPSPVAQVEKPIPPKPLDIPADPSNWTEDDVKRNETYSKEVYDFHQKSAAYMGYITELAKRKPVQQAPVKTEIPVEYQNQVKSLSEQLNTVNQKLKQTEEDTAAEEAKKRNEAYWKTYDTFKDLHKEEFGGEDSYDISSGEMSTKTLEWTDNLAQALGAKLPLTPYNSQDPAWIEYEQQRLQHVNDYVDGKPETLKAVDGVESVQPPKGYKQYFNIVQVRQARDKLIQDGVFSTKSTLHDAWVKLKDNDGTFDSVFTKIQTDTQVDTANKIFDHLQDQQADNATTIPNNLQSSAPDSTQITVAERDRILGLPTDELARDPELKKKHTMILTGQLKVVA